MGDRHTTLAERWTIGYDLDGGGYEFEPAGEPGMLIWDRPDWDYFPFGDRKGDLLLIDAYPAGYDHKSMPAFWVDSSGQKYKLVSEGTVLETEHECGCWGHIDTDTDEWEFTGCASEGNDPYPDCHRCDGTGYVESPGGFFAWYDYYEPPEEF
jgi:hypothetical protein